jgi:hypothetical protein
MESEAMDMIIETVKINKIVFVETYTRVSWHNYLRNAIIIAKRKGRTLIMFVAILRKN